MCHYVLLYGGKFSDDIKIENNEDIGGIDMKLNFRNNTSGVAGHKLFINPHPEYNVMVLTIKKKNITVKELLLDCAGPNQWYCNCRGRLLTVFPRGEKLVMQFDGMFKDLLD